MWLGRLYRGSIRVAIDSQPQHNFFSQPRWSARVNIMRNSTIKSIVKCISGLGRISNVDTNACEFRMGTNPVMQSRLMQRQSQGTSRQGLSARHAYQASFERSGFLGHLFGRLGWHLPAVSPARVITRTTASRTTARTTRTG